MNKDTDLQALVTILQNTVDHAEQDWVEIRTVVARGILAILRALPNSTPKGRPTAWSYFDEQHALQALLRGKAVNELAREMARRTGQEELSARRRLRELKSSEKFKRMKTAARQGVQK